MSLLLLMGDSAPSIGSLFANNEAGLALDVETAYRRGWVYQDSAGATVAAAPGDPVGLILDTARGGLDSLGSDLVSNGTFATDTVWSKGANWTIGSGVATKTGGAANNLTQTITSTAGLWYRITIDVTRTAGELTVSLGTSGTTRVINASGSYTFYILAGSSTQTLTLAGDSSFAGTVDNVTARLVPGNHAYQTTSGSRPALARTPDGGRRNLLTFSEQFDNAVWTKFQATISPNATTAPDGTLTADSIVDTAVEQEHNCYQSTQTTTTASFSVYAKQNGRSVIALRAYSASNEFYTAVFDLSGGTISLQNETGTTFSGVSAAISSAGSGWYRCSITYTRSSGATFHVIDLATNTTPTLGSAGSQVYLGNGTGVFIWGAQLETGSSATAYQKVGLTSDVTESGKRDCWGLLFDGSDDSLQTAEISFNTWTQATRRNLISSTESMSLTWVSTRASVAENATIAPDGTSTADKIVEDNSASNTHRIAIGVTSSATTHTASVYLKAAGRDYAFVFLDANNGTGAFFDLANGVTGAVSGAVTSAIQSVGNGWYRCSVTGGVTATPGMWILTADTISSNSYTGDGTSGIFIWGAQLEAGTLTDYQRVGTDKMTVMAGVRKNTDASYGCIVETGSSFAGTSGSFGLWAGGTPTLNGPQYHFNSRGGAIGTVGQAAVSGNFASPVTNVVSGTGNIPGDLSTIRVNGAASGTNGTDDQGAGNYTAQIIYIGARAGNSFRLSGIIYTLIVRGATTPTGTIADFEKNLLRLRAGLGPF